MLNISANELYAAKYNSYIDLTCDNCVAVFTKYRKNLLRHNKLFSIVHFCSPECKREFGNKLIFTKIQCSNCQTEFVKRNAEIKRSFNHFCSSHCAGHYNNIHKKHGTRRSKLEKYLEESLIQIYPSITFQFNQKNIINSELDIFIPALGLAFELNGIFHYEPIFGKTKLSQTQNNDNRKFQACLEQQIELCIIDTSKQKYFKESTSKIYLDIICNVINQKMTRTMIASND